MEHEYELIPDINSGVRYFMVNTFYRTPHLHRELEICYILEGSLSVTVSNETKEIQQGDFYIVNPWVVHVSHSLSESKRTLVLGLQLSLDVLQDCVPEIFGIQFTFQGYNRKTLMAYDQIVAVLLKGACFYFSQDEKNRLKAKAMTYFLFDFLLEHCNYEKCSLQETAARQRQIERIHSILTYIGENYGRKLTLTEIAERENVTMGYLSHLFNNCLGISFHEYLKRIRCETAAVLLQSTTLSLLDVSEQCGFSDIKYFRAAFQDRYGCTPRNYRKYNISAHFVASLRINYTISDTEESFISSSECLDILSKYKNTSRHSL